MVQKSFTRNILAVNILMLVIASSSGIPGSAEVFYLVEAVLP